MRFCGSACILFAATALVLAGGTAVPRREDIPKYLTALVKSTSAKDRANAATMIGKRGAISRKDVEEAIEPLKIALQKDADASVRAASARALGSIAPDAMETIPLLMEALDDKSNEVKIATMGALGLYGREASAAVKPIQKIATDNKGKKDKDDARLFQAAQAALKSIRAK